MIALMMMAGLTATPSAEAVPPGDFQTSLVIGDGLDGPSGFEIAPDGRIFILERAGKIKILKNGELLPTPFADLPSEDTGDRGLIGIAFDPDFGVANHYVYFYYTGHDLLNHLVRFSAAEDVATDGPLELFKTSSPSTLLHVGGSIRFGPDGKLYFAVGDNGDGTNAQDLRSPHGKILRINRDGSIPADNPFAGQPGKLGAIWAYGFRNPWRFQFDSATGDLYGGDVGDFTWEEVNHIVKGGNYGWPLWEGVCPVSCPGYLNPIHAYPHAGESAAVTGGPVYRANMFPSEYQGDLFFADYAKGFIKTAELDASGNITAVRDFDTQAGSVVDLKVAPDGSLYYLTYWPGALYRVTYDTESHLPVAAAAADVTKGVEPVTVHFSSTGSQDPDGDPLEYQWAFGDGTTSNEPNPTKTYTDKGVYTARLTVSAAGDQVIAQPIVVQVGLPPDLIVAAPTDGQLYRAGDTITYNAFASDAAGFDLNDANIKTEVRLHHGSHFHPFVGPLTGRAGSFTIPRTGEASADTSYEVKVTATDDNGLSTSKIVNILPRKSEISLATSPPGIGSVVDGVPVSTPRTFIGVEGFQRQLAAPTTAVGEDGTPLQFAGWSDGKAIRHVISTPVDDTTYTARYVPSQPFTGRYYDNTTFSGAPVVTRQDANVNFAWGEGSPDPALPVNGFSVRWTKTQQFGAGRYRITAVADDGLRLFIDGRARDRSMARPRQHGVQPDHGARRGPAHDQDGVPRARWRRHGLPPLGQRAGAVDRPLPGRLLERTAGRQHHPEHLPRAHAPRGGHRPRLGRGLAGTRDCAEPIRGPLDAHLDLRPRRLRVRGDGRRRRAPVRRRSAGDRPMDRPGPDHVPHDAHTRRGSARGRHGVLRERWGCGGPPDVHGGRRSAHRQRIPAASTGTRPMPWASLPSRTRPPISSAPMRRSTSIGATDHQGSASDLTASWHGGRSQCPSRRASTASPVPTTTVCGCTSTTCPSPTGGRSATSTTASTGSSRVAHTSCASSTSRLVEGPGLRSSTSG